MKISNYQDLIVWQKAITLVEEVYRLVRFLPKEELYALSNQMRRSAISIPSNIAEGQQRKSTKEFLNFLSIAKGSSAELQTQLIICERLHYLTKEQIRPCMELLEEVRKMLSKLSITISTNNKLD